jgi:large subunit ribosomal protein L10
LLNKLIFQFAYVEGMNIPCGESCSFIAFFFLTVQERLMALNLEAKKAVVEQVNAVAMSAISVGAAEYRGLNVEQMTNLRNSAIEADVSLRVVKNTLAKRALADTGCECITPVLSGPVILGFSQEDPGAVARVFRDFIKENEDLVIKGLGVSGEFIDADQLKRIASLPTKDQAISMLMALMLAPTEKLVRTLNEVPTKLTRVVSAVRDQKQ